ncbi:hypothetical protein CKC_03375 [Candidatus Liberibacter solanacearum CLso-ZC1]|uniref:Uncharacterized protein n=1 Tax=Liberibacter solanacearum (strain CLso-ZC1) TaxID=658172 RepID=E4UB33_LIBSC|nr:hypothetical protein [Candidatus Liberibacter solanacearum]ADR52424.1 hypothetical protein CKC_03375 [Candidatus Liberibacter solanacearum CLso-ZC1]
MWEEPPLSDDERISNVFKDVERLRPLSSISKVTEKEADDTSLSLDYTKEENKQPSYDLPDAISKRFDDLKDSKSWIKRKPTAPHHF